jgi:OOP family OmpA-OmpF porin
MKEINTRHLLLLAAIASLIGSSALADEDSYFYGGIGLGQSRARIDVDRVTANLLASGLTTTNIDRDEKHLAYKVFGGYEFNRFIALEGGYFNLGRFGYTATTLPAGTLDGRIKLQGINLDVVGAVPLNASLSIIARVGAIYADARDDFHGSGAVVVLDPDPSQRKVGFKFGGGLQYAFNRSVLARAEAERYRVPDALGNRGDINMFSVSLVFPFGRAAPPPPPVAAVPPPPPPPEPVAAAPPPPPPPPVVPARRRVSFQADSLFTFDRSNVRPEGRVALDKFAHELVGTKFQTITVEGYTDRLGSEAYNQRLSVERADAVKRYLVESDGIDASRISVEGKGTSNPITKPGDCEGKKRTPRLIACLQPDRRVEIEVTGSKAGSTANNP